MVIARLINDRWISLEGNPYEIERVGGAFTKKVNSWYIIKKKNPNANVDETFMAAGGIIPLGLWVELINVCKIMKIELVFSEDFEQRITQNISYEEFRSYVDELFAKSDKKPKDYQIEGAYRMIKYKNCCVEISTSGGKTLISYIVFRFMIDVLKMKHILFVTPKTELTVQSADKFILYDKWNGKDSSDWSYSEIHADAKKQKTYDENIVFGNYQSLNKKSKDFFGKFDVVIIDEGHHSKNNSIRNILSNCCNAVYKIGMTGTFPPADSYDSYVIQANIGPLVYRFTSYELINEEKFATPVHVNMIALKYLDEDMLRKVWGLRNFDKTEDPAVGSKILNKEKDIAKESDLRMNFIVRMIGKTTNNTLVLFSDVQDEYGRKIYNNVKERTMKRVFYIDGGTPTRTRNNMIHEMETDVTGNTVIVSSIRCFSEGIDIGNMWNIFLVETTKSENTIAQILGRGMRRFEGKEKTMMIDFVDDFRYGNDIKYHENYLWKHGMQRYDIYTRRGFPCNFLEVDLLKG